MDNKDSEFSKMVDEIVTKIGEDGIKGIIYSSNKLKDKIKRPKYSEKEGKFIIEEDIRQAKKRLIEYTGPKDVDIVIPDGVNIIGSRVFGNCAGLIIVPDSVTTIENYAFYRCTGLTTIPDSVTKIGYYAFHGCTSLTSIPDSVTAIGEGAFVGCTSLTTIPDSVTAIGDYAFIGCTSLTTIPDSVTIIGSSAFAGCTNLKVLNISENLKSIEPGAFEKCPIERVNIPLTMKKLIIDLNNIPIDTLMVNNIPIKKFTGDVDFLDNQGIWVEQVNVEPQQDNEILKQIIRNTKKDNLKSNFWDVVNLESFQENLKLFREIGIPEEEIPNLFVSNYQLLGSDLNNILTNYRYLDEQEIIKSGVLQKLFFQIVDGDSSNNLEKKSIEKQKEITKNILGTYYQLQKKLPELFSKLAFKPTDVNQKELRDALKVAQHRGLFDFSKKENYQKLRYVLLRKDFDLIIEEDEKTFNADLDKNDKNHVKLNEQYSKYFAGMKSPFYRKLTGINEEWFDLLMDESNSLISNNAFEQFFYSLTTVQRWNALDKKERATLLKNEIIGRLLYAGYTISESTGKDIDKIGATDFPQLLKIATGSTNEIFKDEGIIKKMLAKDPYSFDALRTDAHNLEYNYCVDAKKNGYLFSANEIAKYASNNPKKKQELEKNPEFKHFIEHINNEIGIPKIAKNDRNEYLNKTKEIIRLYLKEKASGRNDIKDLLELMDLTDLYLRDNSGYESLSAKGKIIEETAKKVFDKNSGIKVEDQLLYTMYNLNRLAHNVIDINIKVDFVNKRFGNQIDVKKMEAATKALVELSRFGLDMKNIGAYICSHNRLESLVSEEDLDVKSKLLRFGLAMYNNPDFVYDRNELEPLVLEEEKVFNGKTGKGKYNKKLMKKLKEIVPSQNEEETLIPLLEIDSSNIEKIRLNLKTLLELNKEGFITKDIEEKLETYVNERRLFFDTKAIVAQELVYSKIMDFAETTNFIDMNVQEKKEFYKNNGYIIEIQNDKNNPVLVCYSKTFREAFGIHLKNMPPELETKINKYLNSPNYQPTIAYTKLDPPGVTLRTENFNPNYSKNPIREITEAGFYANTNEYSAAIYNFMEYDLYEKINTLKANKEAVKNGQYTEELVEYFKKLNVDEWFKNFDEIQDEKDNNGNQVKGGKKGKKYVGQVIPILDRIKSEPKNPSQDIHCLGVKTDNINDINNQLAQNKQKLSTTSVQSNEVTPVEIKEKEQKQINQNPKTKPKLTISENVSKILKILQLRLGKIDSFIKNKPQPNNTNNSDNSNTTKEDSNQPRSK